MIYGRLLSTPDIGRTRVYKQSLGEMDVQKPEKEPFFKKLEVNDSDPGVTEMESLCMACQENVGSVQY